MVGSFDFSQVEILPERRGKNLTAKVRKTPETHRSQIKAKFFKYFQQGRFGRIENRLLHLPCQFLMIT